MTTLQEKLPRNLGMWGIWLLVVNGLVGAGIFGLPSGAARLAGDWSPLVYIFCALLILPILLSFAELASYFRGTGGPIRYATEAFGHFVGFQAGWLFWVARVVSFSANSVLLVDSIGYFWPSASEGIGRLLALLLICGGLTVINVLGSLRAIHSLAALTVLKFAVLILLVIGAVIQLGGEVLPSIASTPGADTDLGAATLLLIYAFVGFESAVVPAGEARQPSRDMPRALLLGLGLVTLLYLAIQLVSVAAVPDIAGSDSPLLDVADVLFGPVGAIVLMIGVLASVGGNLVGAIFSTPRITYALSLDESLPRWFGAVHPRFRTPANSIIFYGLLSFLLAAFGTFTFLAAATVLSRLLMYGVSCAAIPVLRPRYATADRFILPFGYTIPLLGLAACGWLLLQVSAESFLLTGIFIAVGTGFYWLARRQRDAMPDQE